MQIHCPSCAAVYNLPVILLTMARTMRCAVCAHDWQTIAVDSDTAQAALLEEARPAPPVVPPGAPPIAPPVASAAVANDDAPEIEGHNLSVGNAGAPDRPPAVAEPTPASATSPPIRPRSRLRGLFQGAVPALVGWVCSVAVLFVGGRVVVGYRADLMAVWPPSRRLFLWLGLS